MIDSDDKQTKFCTECGKQLNIKAEICPGCGVRVATAKSGRSEIKLTLVLLTFFLGGLGAHKFYTKKYLIGFLYILFCWTGIPSIIALIEFIIYLTKSEQELQAKFPETSGSGIIIAIVIAFFALVVVGILAAIAIPQFSAYREKSYNSAAKSDLRNCRTECEAFYADNRYYPKEIDQLSCQLDPKVSLYYIVLGENDIDNYQLIAFHEDGTTAYLTKGDSVEIATNDKSVIEGQLLEKDFNLSSRGNLYFVP